MAASNGSERNYWIFNVPGGDLLTAIEIKLTHHTERVTYWKTETEKAEADFRAQGISLDGDEQDAFTTASYGNNGGSVKIDPKKQRAWTFAKGKLAEHESFAAAFGRWKKLIAREAADRVYPITADDATFFGITDPVYP